MIQTLHIVPEYNEELIYPAICKSINALKVSIPSIIVSAMGLFSATFGVALYSDVDIISSLCDLMARGAIVSMFAVILFLPAMFMLFDKMICVTSIGFRNKNAEPSNTLKERTA